MTGEILDQAPRLGIGEHALHLGFHYLRLVQLLLRRERSELIIRHAAPEKIRETRRQFVVVQAAGVTGFAAGIEFPAKQKLRRNEDGLRGELHALLEGTSGDHAQLHELRQPGHFLLRRRPTKGAAGKLLEVLARQLLFLTPLG